ncbi:MAG: flagellar type III secretion system pore protein FliP [Gracilibacteraceae bacterium]|jgi:flagellar biosynthetic protein FliP|nr:flagellar type III secretion system pore protein FliP [Gracilibacteraceae bacterium]
MVDLEGLLSGQTNTLEILFLLSVVTLLPSIIVMMTSFTRIIIVLSFLRNALGMQQSPPNQVLVGIALFLSLFIMQPVVGAIYTDAYLPYEAGEIDGETAVTNMQLPLKEFMLRQTKPSDLNIFLGFAEAEMPENPLDLSMTVVVPSFMTSELRQAFIMGFLIYLPFIVIDMVVASTLMSMGMIMLPPVMISMPFKLLLFVLVDGWALTVDTLVRSFH